MFRRTLPCYSGPLRVFDNTNDNAVHSRKTSEQNLATHSRKLYHPSILSAKFTKLNWFCSVIPNYVVTARLVHRAPGRNIAAQKHVEERAARRDLRCGACELNSQGFEVTHQ